MVADFVPECGRHCYWVIGGIDADQGPIAAPSIDVKATKRPPFFSFEAVGGQLCAERFGLERQMAQVGGSEYVSIESGKRALEFSKHLMKLLPIELLQ